MVITGTATKAFEMVSMDLHGKCQKVTDIIRY